MLNHIGQTHIAEKIQNAWLRTLEEGIHTADIYKDGLSKQQVGTQEFAEAVIANLGEMPEMFAPVEYKKDAVLNLPKYQKKPQQEKLLKGVDVFVDWNGTDANELAALLSPLESDNIKLSMITNRGIKVWPNGFEETFCTDHWRCRYKPVEGYNLTKKDIVGILAGAEEHEIDSIKTENLYSFDGRDAFSLGQGQ